MSGESAVDAIPKDWHSSKHIHKRARHLLEHPDEEIPSDVTFLVGDGKNEPQKMFKCHKFLLAMVSSMFQAMFFGSFPETEDPIKVPDVTPKAFQYMLRYAYGENIDLSSIECMGDALDILYCAKKYLIGKLARTCRDHIQLNIVALESDPCEVFQRAPQMDEDDLASLALTRIAQTAPDVMKGDALLRLSFDCLKKIVDCPHLHAKETEIYQGVHRWIEHNMAGTALREAFGSLLHSIRFPLFGATELADGPAADGILSPEEASTVFRFLLAKNNKPTVPFFTTPRVPLAASMSYTFRLVTAPATGHVGRLIGNRLYLYLRPDLAPEACAFLRQLVNKRSQVRIASYDNEHPAGRTVAIPEFLAVERNALSYSVRSACWFEWDVEEGTARNLRIAVGKKPDRYHSAVFAFVFGLEAEDLLVPFDLFDDKRIQSVTDFRMHSYHGTGNLRRGLVLE